MKTIVIRGREYTVKKTFLQGSIATFELHGRAGITYTIPCYGKHRDLLPIEPGTILKDVVFRRMNGELQLQSE